MSSDIRPPRGIVMPEAPQPPPPEIDIADLAPPDGPHRPMTVFLTLNEDNIYNACVHVHGRSAAEALLLAIQRLLETPEAPYTVCQAYHYVHEWSYECNVAAGHVAKEQLMSFVSDRCSRLGSLKRGLEKALEGFNVHTQAINRDDAAAAARDLTQRRLNEIKAEFDRLNDIDGRARALGSQQDTDAAVRAKAQASPVPADIAF